MDEEIKSEESIGISGILKQSLRLYKENIFLFIGIAFLGEVPELLNILSAILPKTIHRWISVIILPLSILILAWASIALIIAASNKYLNNGITLRECFTKTKGKYWRFIGINILCFLIFGTGLLLLVIPGIYLGTIFSLAGVAVVLETRKNIGPLRISKEFIKGSLWKVFLLGLIMLILWFPSYLIYFAHIKLKLVNIHLTMLLDEIFCIFYMPFSTILEVTLYHNLKKRKEGMLPLEPVILVKRGKCCLGWLTAFGLVILISVLSIFWFSGLLKFSKTEKGSQVTECIKRTVSPRIIFPEGVMIERPRGWFVLKVKDHLTGYNLLRLENREIKNIRLFSIAIKDLNLPKTILSLDDRMIADRILERTIKRNRLMKKGYEGYEPEIFRVIEMGGCPWGEYVLKKTMKTEYDTSIYMWKNMYTIFDDYVLIASYVYKYKLEEGEMSPEAKKDLLKEEKEIQDFIASFYFPNTKKEQL